jgi:hypothetical protein
VLSISFRSIDTACIKSTVNDATGFDRSTLVLAIVAVVADNRLYLLRSCDRIDVDCDTHIWRR